MAATYEAHTGENSDAEDMDDRGSQEQDLSPGPLTVLDFTFNISQPSFATRQFLKKVRFVFLTFIFSSNKSIAPKPIKL